LLPGCDNVNANLVCGWLLFQICLGLSFSSQDVTENVGRDPVHCIC
jgi:hypothetical protein